MDEVPEGDEVSTCSGCYVYGVLISLLASSFQSLGYALWRLHHLRKQRQRVHPGEVGTVGTVESAGRVLPAASESSLHGAEGNMENTGELQVDPTDEGEVLHEHRTQDGPQSGEQEAEKTSKPAPAEIIDSQPSCWQSTSFYGVPWVWLCGLAAIGVGNGLDFISLGLTKQSVVTLVGSWSLVVTTFISPLLGEKLTRTDLIAACVTIVGIILTVLGGYTEITDWSTEKLIRQYRQPHVVAMLTVLACAVLLVVSMLFADYYRRSSSARNTQLPLEGPNHRTIGPLYILLASLIATFTVLLGKATSEMLLPTLTGDNRFTSPAALLLVVAFLISLPSQLMLISASLAINDSLLHVPTFYVFWIFGSITTGAIFYEEMASFTLLNWMLFAFGVATLLVGVVLTNIAARRKPPTT